MNDELTPREHSEMRDSILAGAQRIHSAGQRRMRMIAVSVAFVLVAGISGGAVATAALIGSGVDDGPVATPTETSSPAPTPTSTPTQPPAPSSEGAVAFGGDCTRPLAADDVSAAVGVEMVLVDLDTRLSETAVLGGIECRWAEPSGTTPYFAVAVYPESAVPAVYSRQQSKPGCVGTEGATLCSVTGTVGTTWYSLSATDEHTAALAPLADLLEANIAAAAAPRPAAASSNWWSLPACERLGDVDIAGALGVEGELAREYPVYEIEPERSMHVPDVAGAVDGCVWRVGETVNHIRIVPGGGIAFAQIAAREDAEPITVNGASQAVTVEQYFAGGESWRALVATDGVNLLVIRNTTGDVLGPADAATLAPLASELLAAL